MKRQFSLATVFRMAEKSLLRRFLESLHAELHMLRIKRFERCIGRFPAWPDLSQEALVALEDTLNDWFDSLHKGRGVQVMVYERGGTIWFHLWHGEFLKSDSDLQNNGMTKRIVYRPERYDCVGYTPHECELLIHAETKREKKAYCRLFGKLLFRDENFFHFGERVRRGLSVLKKKSFSSRMEKGLGTFRCYCPNRTNRFLLRTCGRLWRG